MSIRVPCPNPECGTPLLAREDQVGKRIKCPRCKQALSVPLAGSNKGFPEKNEPTAMSAGKQDQTPQPKAHGPGWLVMLLLVLVFAGVSLAAVWIVRQAEDLKEQVADLQGQHQTADATVSGLKDDLAETKQKVAQKEQDNQQLTSKLVEANKLLTEAKQRGQQTASQNDDLSKRWAASEKKAIESAGKNEELTKRLAEAERKASELAAGNEALKKRLAEAERLAKNGQESPGSTTPPSTTSGNSDLEKLQGTWKVIEIESKGKKSELNSSDKNALLIGIKGDRYYSDYGAYDPLGHAYTLDPAKGPKQITLLSLEGDKKVAELGIYSLEGDRLKLCLGPAGKERPTTFATKPESETQCYLLKRVAPTHQLRPPLQLADFAGEWQGRSFPFGNIESMKLTIGKDGKGDGVYRITAGGRFQVTSITFTIRQDGRYFSIYGLENTRWDLFLQRDKKSFRLINASTGGGVNLEKKQPAPPVAAPDGKDTKPNVAQEMAQEKKRLEGLWIQTYRLSEGWTTTIQGISVGLLIEGETVTNVRIVGGELEKYETGKYTMDPTRSPKTIDITWTDKNGKSTAQLGIYELKEGGLTLSLVESVKPRPEKFDSKQVPITGFVKRKGG